MKIKDVESRVGITKANIRYYEKEGLISPERNDENNYREYSERDVAQLERIKVLRILGIPISDIRELNEGSATLDSVMAHRLDALQEEEKNMEAVRRVCENLMQSSLSYDAVSETILEEDEESWSEQLAKVLKEDITKEILTPAQFNKNLTLMLSWGYFLCAVVSFFLGNWMLSYAGELSDPEKFVATLGLLDRWFPFAAAYDTVFFVPFILAIICYIMMYFTANIKILLVIFHISALNLSPVIASAYMLIDGMTSFQDTTNTSLGGKHLAVFWFMLSIYVVILFLLSKTWKSFFDKPKYVITAAVIYTAVMTLLAGMLSGLWLVTFVGFFLFTMFIGLNWFHACQTIKGRSRYYALTEGLRIMNLFGVAFDMRGKTTPPFVQR